MAFPTTAILDNFNRADAQPPSANWTSGWLGIGIDLQIISNQCAADTASTTSDSYWNAATFTGDAEVYVSVPVRDSAVIYLGLHITSPGATVDGYVLIISGTTWDLSRIDDGSATSLVTATQTVSDGDAIGLELVGTTLTMYYKASGGSWTALDTATDSTYTSGYVGAALLLSADTRLDDFGGGEISSADASHNVSDSATLTDTASVSISFSLSDSVTLDDSATLAASFSLSDSAAIDDSASLAASFSLSDNLTVSDTAALESAYSLSDSLTLTESISIEVQLSASDDFTFSDTASLAAALSASDSLTLSDSASRDTLFTGVNDAERTSYAHSQRETDYNNSHTTYSRGTTNVSTRRTTSTSRAYKQRTSEVE